MRHIRNIQSAVGRTYALGLLSKPPGRVVYGKGGTCITGYTTHGQCQRGSWPWRIGLMVPAAGRIYSDLAINSSAGDLEKRLHTNFLSLQYVRAYACICIRFFSLFSIKDIDIEL